MEANGCKKRKRGEQRVYRFKTFCEHGYPLQFEGSFRENVKELLEFGHFEGNISNGMPSWSFQLEVSRHSPFQVFLFVVEEPIDASLEHHCKQCQYVGWGHHMICNKKYHFVMPSRDTVREILYYEQGSIEDGVTRTKGKFNFVELQGHIMHGVFHSSGFGHLLSINGIEAGFNLAGRQIVDFWDRLCTGLRAREVSLYDISQKRGLDLRLLYGVAYGEPWFGRWGYKFGRGSYGVTQPMYHQAIETIQCIPLYILVNYLGGSNHDIPVIFSRYQALSEHCLSTLSDLFRFMLDLKTRLPQENCGSTGISVEPTCRWSPKRIEMATRVIVDSLKRAEFRWLSRQEVRDAARIYIGDTGLLDFVLKSLGNHIVGNYFVRRSLNPVTKVLEYCLEDVSDVFPDHQGRLDNSKLRGRYNFSKSQVMRDISYLYRYVLKDQRLTWNNTGILAAIAAAARIILDTKYFVKEYFEEVPSKIEVGLEGKLKLYCTVVLRTKEGAPDGTNNATPTPPIPFECITLKNNATINELLLQVERNFKELYWGLRSFVAESILNLNGADGKDFVFGLVEVGRKLVFEGGNKEGGMINELMYESGRNGRVADCPCGATDDDGERMISCDICEVWQHSRCIQIPDNQELPHLFLCNSCEHEISVLPPLA